MEHGANCDCLFPGTTAVPAVVAIFAAVALEIWEYSPMDGTSNCMSRTRPPPPVLVGGQRWLLPSPDEELASFKNNVDEEISYCNVITPTKKLGRVMDAFGGILLCFAFGNMESVDNIMRSTMKILYLRRNRLSMPMRQSFNPLCCG
jgi:hypothetical protein